MRPAVWPSSRARSTASWQGSFFIGSLSSGTWSASKLGADDRVIEQEKLFPDAGRMRDVREGPDGLLYLVLETAGRVVRVKP